MTDLRTNLQRLADSADPLPVDDDLWQRGQASRRRGQALVVAAVLAIIASVTWSAVLLGTGAREARTASTDVVPGGAIPSRIVAVTDDLEPTTDLAVGAGSAAYLSTSRQPIIVTARDGEPRQLSLAGWTDDNQGLALSPDGTRLAWDQRADGAGASIGVLDLVTGRSTTYDVRADVGLRLREMTWSPDSSRLAWIGDTGANGAYVGWLEAGSDAPAEAFALRATPQDAAISDEGLIVISKVSGGLFRVDGGDASVRITDADSVGAGMFSPDGSYLSLRSSLEDASFTYRVRDAKILRHPFPDGTFGRPAIFPLGWLDDRLEVLQVTSTSNAASELVVTTPQVSATSTWRRSVGSIDSGVSLLSLAVDLIPDLDGTSSQQLTHDFGDPLGSDQRDLSWIIGLCVAAAIAVLMALRWLLRRLLG